MLTPKSFWYHGSHKYEGIFVPDFEEASRPHYHIHKGTFSRGHTGHNGTSTLTVERCVRNEKSEIGEI